MIFSSQMTEINKVNKRLRWLTAVLMEDKSPTFKPFEKCTRMFLLSQITICYSLPPLYVILEQFKRQKRAKMNDRVPKERLGTSIE